MYKQDLKTV